MKRFSIVCLFVFVVCLFCVPSLSAQTLEKETSQELSKDARKGELFNFAYDEGNQVYTLVFKREKKKEDIYEVYQFDYDLKMINNETMDVTKAKEKYADAVILDSAPDEGWSDPMVVRVDPNWGGQIVLRQGTLSREWAKSVEEKGNYRYTTWYWKYTFNEQKNEKPKFEGLVDVPEGAPDWVIKMAQNSSEQVKLITYATDEPSVEITTGKQNFVYGSVWARQRDYASASGDILIVGRSDQMDFDTKAPKTIYLSMKYSAEDLSQKHYETFTLGYEQNTLFKQQLGDGSIVLVFSPASYPGLKNKDPNPSNWTYVRVGYDAVVQEQINFDCKGGWWEVNSATLTDDGSVLLYGLASTKKKDKYYTGNPIAKYDNVQAVKITDGAVSWVSTVDLATVKGKMRTPKGQKKSKPWAGSDMALDGQFTVTSSGDLIFTGQAADHSALYGFHFDPAGAFKAHYVFGTSIQNKEYGIDHAMFENLDKKTLTCYMGELENVEDGRALKVPRMATIDIASTEVSAIQTFGFGKKGEYYLDDVYPFTFIDELSKVVLFSRDKKDSEIWLGRVKLGP